MWTDYLHHTIVHLWAVIDFQTDRLRVDRLAIGVLALNLELRVDGARCRCEGVITSEEAIHHLNAQAAIV